jgi:serine/threonine-protein kinase
VGDRYRIVAPLARGGFGAVYVAEQLTTERRVALKVLARYDEAVSVQRLLSEARVTSRIVSDHIVQVIDAGVDTGTGDVFVVMELLRGVTLDERVMAHGALPWPEAAELLRQVAVGLDKAHGHLDRAGTPMPIVHRDLKPSNIFLTERDDGQTLVKILDFGAAKVLSQTTKASGVIRGTPQFMASEQAMGEPSSEATDIWAFGLIAFYLLTGRSYWLTVEKAGTEAQLFAEILTLPLVAASARAKELGVDVELPPQFDRWFSRCVNRDRAQRFGSAGQASGELSRLLGVPAPRSSEPPRPSTSTAPVVAAARRAVSPLEQLETHDHAALSSSSGLSRPSRTRAGLAMLGVLLAAAVGAAAVLAWKRAPIDSSAPSSISASPAPASSRLVPTSEAPPVVAPSSAPSGAEPIPPRAAPKPGPSVRASSGEKRPPPTARPKPLDPYEQR